MNCKIGQRNVKTFGRAVHCLAKIGEEMYLEGLAEGLTLKTTNSSRTAYSSFLFNENYFLSYFVVQDGSTARCKLAMRPFLNIFKSLSTLDKSVDHVTMEIDTSKEKLLIRFHYKHGLVKTHLMGFEDCDSLQAVFDKHQCPNLISGSSELFGEVTANFPLSLEEVCLTASDARLIFRSYVETGEDAKFGMTEVNLAPVEFDVYSIKSEASVVFSIKTMRSLLTFAESGGLKALLRIDSSGKPVMLSLEGSSEFEVDMVLATLADTDLEDPQTFSQVSTSVETRMDTEHTPNITERHNVLDQRGFSPVPSPPSTLPTLRNDTPSEPEAVGPPDPAGGSSLRDQEGVTFDDVDFGLTRTRNSITDVLFGNEDNPAIMEGSDDELVLPSTPQPKRCRTAVLWDATLLLAPNSDPED